MSGCLVVSKFYLRVYLRTPSGIINCLFDFVDYWRDIIASQSECLHSLSSSADDLSSCADDLSRCLFGCLGYLDPSDW